MSPQDRTSVRWLLPGILLVLGCAGLMMLTRKHSSSDIRQRAGTLQEAERQKTSLATGTNRPLISAPVTNQTKVADREERVVALVTEGNQLLGRGSYTEAAEKYEQAVAIAPGEEDLHYNLGIALGRLGKPEEAKKQYEEALRIFPDYADAHNNLGNLLMNEKKLEEAVDHFREAVKSMPENALFHNNLGTALGLQRKVAEAIGEFEEAVKHGPTYVEARVNLANAFLAAGRVKEAIDQLDEALRLKPDFKPAVQVMQRARQRYDASGAEK